MKRDLFVGYEIAQMKEGVPVELLRLRREVVCLAFDLARNRLVELHLFEPSTGDEKEAAEFKRLLGAAMNLDLSPSYPAVTDGGERHGVCYFSCDLRTGEPVERYWQRTGGIPASHVVALGLDLVDGLLSLTKNAPGLLPRLSLEGTSISADGSGRLRLMIGGFGLAGDSADSDLTSALSRGIEKILRNLGRIGEVHFEAIFGKATAGRASLDCEQELRLLRADLQRSAGCLSPDQCSIPCVGIGGITAPEPFYRIALGLDGPLPKVVSRSVIRPKHHDDPSPNMLGAIKLQEVGGPDVFGGHVLPARRVVDSRHLGCLAPGCTMPWSTGSENVTATLGCWIGEDGVVVTEDYCSGFSLERIVRSREMLDLAEISLLIEQVTAGIEQAEEVGVEIASLHPSTILVEAAGKLEEACPDVILQTSFLDWPEFNLKLSSHPSVASLILRPPSEFFLPAGLSAIDRSYAQRMVLEALCLARLVCGHSLQATLKKDQFVEYIDRCIAREIHHAGSVKLEVFDQNLRELAGKFYSRRRSILEATDEEDHSAEGEGSIAPLRREQSRVSPLPSEGSPFSGSLRKSRVPSTQHEDVEGKAGAKQSSVTLEAAEIPPFPKVLSGRHPFHEPAASHESKDTPEAEECAGSLPPELPAEEAAVYTARIRAESLRKFIEEQEITSELVSPFEAAAKKGGGRGGENQLFPAVSKSSGSKEFRGFQSENKSVTKRSNLTLISPLAIAGVLVIFFVGAVVYFWWNGGPAGGGSRPQLMQSLSIDEGSDSSLAWTAPEAEAFSLQDGESDTEVLQRRSDLAKKPVQNPKPTTPLFDSRKPVRKTGEEESASEIIFEDEKRLRNLVAELYSEKRGGSLHEEQFSFGNTTKNEGRQSQRDFNYEKSRKDSFSPAMLESTSIQEQNSKPEKDEAITAPNPVKEPQRKDVQDISGQVIEIRRALPLQ